MNVATLYAQVAALGFETNLEDAEAFYHTANRAIYQVNRLRPMIAEHEIFHRNQRNILPTDFSTYTRDEDLIFEAAGARAYYFEAAGNGTLYTEERADDGTWKLIGIAELASVDFVPYRGFIKAGDRFTDGNVRLRFSGCADGDYTYFVRNVAMYARLFGKKEDEIEAYRPWKRYDISAICHDFLTLASPPITADDMIRLPSGYEVEGERCILLPYGAEGTYRVLYHRKPETLDYNALPDGDTTEIDLDEELCTLLPLLIAAYIWADDEEEKANYYMTLYNMRAAEILAVKKISAQPKFIDKSGW